jgi:hypothetical protein
VPTGVGVGVLVDIQTGDPVSCVPRALGESTACDGCNLKTGRLETASRIRSRGQRKVFGLLRDAATPAFAINGCQTARPKSKVPSPAVAAAPARPGITRYME